MFISLRDILPNRRETYSSWQQWWSPEIKLKKKLCKAKKKKCKHRSFENANSWTHTWKVSKIIKAAPTSRPAYAFPPDKSDQAVWGNSTYIILPGSDDRRTLSHCKHVKNANLEPICCAHVSWESVTCFPANRELFWYCLTFSVPLLIPRWRETVRLLTVWTEDMMPLRKSHQGSEEMSNNKKKKKKTLCGLGDKEKYPEGFTHLKSGKVKQQKKATSTYWVRQVWWG